MEQLEMFLPDGTHAGCGVDRARAHAEGVLHGASHVFICRKRNGEIEMLLQRRALCKDSFPGCLDISSAGHIERGSDFLETALKEMSEELGLSISPDDLTELLTQTVDIQSVFHGKPFIDREINRVYLYVPEGEPAFRIQEEELSETVWMNLNTVLARVRANDPEYCLEADELERAVRRIGEIMNG